MAKQMKFIFVTGGVVSSLGKGISAACIGRLLKRRGLNIFSMKLDPYLNIDPGTMSPYQHGEVFVTKDGAETDLDLGHYERIINTSLTKESSVTSGKVYSTVLEKERKGEFLGATIQLFLILLMKLNVDYMMDLTQKAIPMFVLLKLAELLAILNPNHF